MNPTTALLIMMNNYFHDVATALLLASGVAMWLIASTLGEKPCPETVTYFLAIYRTMTRLAIFSLIWILLGGIPRTLAYRQFEWANAVGKSQVTALVVKHILAFLFVAIGVGVWIKLNRIVKKMKQL